MNIIEDKITTLHCSIYLREILIILHTYLHSFLTSVYLAIYDIVFYIFKYFKRHLFMALANIIVSDIKILLNFLIIG